jgi:hypothetical protein
MREAQLTWQVTRAECAPTSYGGASGSAHFSYSFEKRRRNKPNDPPFILYIYGSLRVTRHTNLICPPDPGSLGTARGLLSLSGLT